jgi:hypothetical protein
VILLVLDQNVVYLLLILKLEFADVTWEMKQLKIKESCKIFKRSDSFSKLGAGVPKEFIRWTSWYWKTLLAKSYCGAGTPFF